MINENVAGFFSEDTMYQSSNGDGYASSINEKLNPFMYELMQKFSVFSLQILPASKIYVMTFEDTNTAQVGKVYPTALFRDDPDFYRYLCSAKHGGTETMFYWMDTRLEAHIHKQEQMSDVMVQLVRLVRGELTSDEINLFYFQNRSNLVMTDVFQEIATQPLIVKKKDKENEE